MKIEIVVLMIIGVVIVRVDFYFIVVIIFEGFFGVVVFEVMFWVVKMRYFCVFYI